MHLIVEEGEASPSYCVEWHLTTHYDDLISLQSNLKLLTFRLEFSRCFFEELPTQLNEFVSITKSSRFILAHLAVTLINMALGNDCGNGEHEKILIPFTLFHSIYIMDLLLQNLLEGASPHLQSSRDAHGTHRQQLWSPRRAKINC